MHFDILEMIDTVKEAYFEEKRRRAGRLELSVTAYNKLVDDWNEQVRRSGEGETLRLISDAAEAPKGLEVKELNLYVVDKEDWYFCIGANPNELDNSAK